MGTSNNLWWCKNCGVPLLKKKCEACGYEGVKICSDLKPMFKEECRFLENEQWGRFSKHYDTQELTVPGRQNSNLLDFT